MNNPLHITRLFRADHLRRQQREALRHVSIRPGARPRAGSKLDRDAVVFVACLVLAYAALILSLLGVI